MLEVHSLDTDDPPELFALDVVEEVATILTHRLFSSRQLPSVPTLALNRYQIGDVWTLIVHRQNPDGPENLSVFFFPERDALDSACARLREKEVSQQTEPKT